MMLVRKVARAVFQPSAFITVSLVLAIGVATFAEASDTTTETERSSDEQLELRAGFEVERGFFDGRPFNAQGSYLSRLLLQLLLILGTPRLLHYFLLQHLWQPRVVSEILSGVILGPSVMGLIPGWMDTVFPTFSIAILGTVASLGLVLFLFMVGLGINSDLIESEWRFVLSCVGLSAAFSMLFAPPLTFLFWRPGVTPHQNEYTRGTFPEMMIFVAVLQGITATGVLARIMAERGILAKRLGGVVMATTAVNLMYQALLVSICLAMFGVSYTWIPPNPLPAGASSPLDAGSKYDPIWICLCYAGYLLLLRFPVRWLFTKLAEKAEKKKKLDMFVVWFSLFCVFACGYFTQTLTLAGRLGGLTFALFAIPRKGTFPQDLRKHVEGLVMLLFMPIFYTWSGLRIDLGIIDGGDVWRVVLLMICCYVVKFSSIYMGACANGMHGFKGAYFGILHATKGFAAMVICNGVYDVGLITKRMLTIAISFSIVTTILVTPLIRGLQLFEKWFKARRAQQQALRVSVLNYSIVAIPSSTGMVEPVLSLIPRLYGDTYAGRNVCTTALRIVNSAEMDDSYAVMYLENATDEQLRTDPLLGACSNFWRPDFRTPLQLAAITAPEQIDDTLGYLYGQGFTGDTIREENVEQLASNCVVMDYVPSTSSLITRLVFDKHVALRLLLGQFPPNVWTEFQHVVVLLGSNEVELQHEHCVVQVLRQLLINNPTAQLSVWKHDVSEENPMPDLESNLLPAADRPFFDGDMYSVLRGLAQSPVPYDLILAPCFFDNSHAPALDVFQNWIRHQADMSNHILDELYYSLVPILLVAAPDQDFEVDLPAQAHLAPADEAVDDYTFGGKMLDG